MNYLYFACIGLYLEYICATIVYGSHVQVVGPRTECHLEMTIAMLRRSNAIHLD